MRRYFQVGVIGYGAGVGPALGGNLAGQELVWIDDVYANPTRVEDRIRKVSDGAGGLIELPIKFPMWLDAVAEQRDANVSGFLVHAHPSPSLGRPTSSFFSARCNSHN